MGVNALTVRISGHKRSYKAITSRCQLHTGFSHHATAADGKGTAAPGAILIPALDVPGTGTFITGGQGTIVELYHLGEIMTVIINTWRGTTKSDRAMNTVAIGIEYLQLATITSCSVVTPGYGKATVLKGRYIRQCPLRAGHIGNDDVTFRATRLIKNTNLDLVGARVGIHQGNGVAITAQGIDPGVLFIQP